MEGNGAQMEGQWHPGGSGARNDRPFAYLSTGGKHMKNAKKCQPWKKQQQRKTQKMGVEGIYIC